MVLSSVSCEVQHCTKTCCVCNLLLLIAATVCVIRLVVCLLLLLLWWKNAVAWKTNFRVDEYHTLATQSSNSILSPESFKRRTQLLFWHAIQIHSHIQQLQQQQQQKFVEHWNETLETSARCFDVATTNHPPSFRHTQTHTHTQCIRYGVSCWLSCHYDMLYRRKTHLSVDKDDNVTAFGAIAAAAATFGIYSRAHCIMYFPHQTHSI